MHVQQGDALRLPWWAAVTACVFLLLCGTAAGGASQEQGQQPSQHVSDDEVQCELGATGMQCQEVSACSSLGGCYGHGICGVGPSCFCDPGWVGEDCSKELCPRECGGHGECTVSGCVCDGGWQGTACDSRQDCSFAVNETVACSGHGRCVDSVRDGAGGEGAMCQCDKGFTGEACETSICGVDCGEHGSCNEQTQECECVQGYSGRECKQRQCPNGCSGHGVCDTGSGKCTCDPEWTTASCSEKACDGGGNCYGHGSCIDGRCACYIGWEGTACEVATCVHNCAGHGTCSNGTCLCDSGWSGQSCQHASIHLQTQAFVSQGSHPSVNASSSSSNLTVLSQCLNDCSGHGACSQSKGCVCDPGWTGSDCSLQRSAALANNQSLPMNSSFANQTSHSFIHCIANCSGNGRCSQQGCACDLGWGGADCASRIGASERGSSGCFGDCSGHGSCLVSHDILLPALCVCDVGWEGEACDLASCAPHNCSGHGQCSNGQCVCNQGWSGADCGVSSNGSIALLQPNSAVSSCPSDCSQAGACLNGTCICDPGRHGFDCSLNSFVPMNSSLASPCGKNCTSVGGLCILNGTPDVASNFSSCACPPNVFQVHGPSGSGICHQVSLTQGCPSDCSSQGTCVNSTCLCDAGFGGSDCSIELASASNCSTACLNGGVCACGQSNSSVATCACACQPGWSGSDCSIALPYAKPSVCLSDCSGHGFCSNSTCLCDPGWQGEDCSHFAPCPQNCSGNGVCTEGGLCSCYQGWLGLDCSSSTVMGCVGGADTNCTEGLLAVHGQLVISQPQDDCGGCKHGSCSNTTQECDCEIGYIGSLCDTGPFGGDCPGNCHGHGVCELVPGVDGGPPRFECSCDMGWQGSGCNTPRCPGDCNGRGGCLTNGTCLCYEHWSGNDCGDADCLNDCSGQGTCVGGQGCVCDRGFQGEDCSFTTCDLNCTLNGVCIDGNCTCFYGWGGPACDQIVCPLNCSNHGTCINGTCLCESGWFGTNCSDIIGTFSLTDVYPSVGNIAGGSNVYLSGTGFVLSQLFCKFGSIVVPGKFFSSSLVSCVSPPQSAGVVFVQVSLDGAIFTEVSGRFLFQYYAPPVVEAVRWPFSPAAGGIPISVQGVSFKHALAPRCKFGSLERPGQLVVTASKNGSGILQENGFIVCTSPALHEHPDLVPGENARVQFSVSINGGTPISSDPRDLSLPQPEGNTDTNWLQLFGFTYMYYYGISHVLPPAGTVYGGTVVRVVAYNAFRGLYLRSVMPDWAYRYACEWRTPDGAVHKDLSDPSTYQSTPQGVVSFACTSPTVTPSLAGATDLRFSLNPDLLPVSTETVAYNHAEPFIAAISISAASTLGGAMVTVSGSQIQKYYAPPLEEGNPQPAAPLCRWVVNGYDSAGTPQGSVHTTSGSWLESKAIQCPTPAGIAAGSAQMDTAPNAVDWSNSHNDFIFHSLISVESLGQDSAFMEGGSVIIIEGSGFIPSLSAQPSASGTVGHPACQFQVGQTAVAVAGAILSPSKIACTAPPGVSLVTPIQTSLSFAANVSASMNGVEFVQCPQQATFFNTPAWNSLDWSVVPAGGAAANVLVNGRRIVDSVNVTCRVMQGSVVLDTQGTSSSSSQTALCPMHAGLKAGNFTMEISVDGKVFGSVPASPKAFELETASPTLIPATGGTKITISGQGLSSLLPSSLICHFGDTSVQAAPIQGELDKATCISPVMQAQFMERNISVSASTPLASARSLPLPLKVFQNFTVASFFPKAGPSRGGSSVLIVTEPIQQPGIRSLAATCELGGRTSLAHYDNSRGGYVCVTPPIPSTGLQPLRLYLEDQHKVTAGNFFVFESLHPTSVAPRFSPVEGGITITLTSSNFLAVESAIGTVSLSIACRFDAVRSNGTAPHQFNRTAAEVQGLSLGQGKVQCAVPMGMILERSSAHTVSVGLSADGLTFDFGTANVIMHKQIQLSLSPVSGPLGGGQPTTILLDPFFAIAPEETIVRWSGQTVSAQASGTPGVVAAASPASALIQAVSVMVSIDGGQSFSLAAAYNYFSLAQACGGTNDCRGRGQCQGASCACNAGFSGFDCSTGAILQSVTPSVVDAAKSSTITLSGLFLDGSAAGAVPVSPLLYSDYRVQLGGNSYSATFSGSQGVVTVILPALHIGSNSLWNATTADIKLLLPPLPGSEAFGSAELLLMPTANVSHVLPTVMSAVGGTTLTLYGRSFTGDSSTRCVLIASDGTSILDTELPPLQMTVDTAICRFQGTFEAGNSYVSIQTHGILGTAAALKIASVESPTSLFPTALSLNGGNITAVTALQVPQVSTLRCVLVDTSGTMAAVSDAQASGFRAICMFGTLTSLQAGGNYSLHLSTDSAQTWTAVGQPILLFTPLSLSSVVPSVAFSSGGLVVTVSGNRMVQLQGSTCIFSSGRTPFTVISQTSGRCSVPASSGNVEGSMSVSLNGVEPSTSLNFLQVAVPSVTATNPRGSSLDGGALVSISGSFMADTGSETVCLFGDARVPAETVLAPFRTVVCRAPAARLASPASFSTSGSTPSKVEVNVSVSLSHGRELFSDPQPFLYFKHPVMNDIVPSLGQRVLSTPVQVVAEGLLDISSSKCRFGTQTVQAALVSLSSSSLPVLVCQSPIPSSQSIVNVPFEVSLDGQTFTSQGILRFAFLQDFSLSSITPSAGPVVGGTVITLTGTAFSQSSYLTCFFGAASVPAVYIDSTTARCTSPSVNSDTQVPVSISHNGRQDHACPSTNPQLNCPKPSTGTDFLFFSQPKLLSIRPSYGRVQGGTTVRLALSSVNPLLQNLMVVRFAQTSVPVLEFIGNEVLVSTPAASKIETHTIAVQLSLNGGGTFGVSSVPFSFYVIPTIEQLSPNLATSNGNATLTVFGKTFLNTTELRCAFFRLGAINQLPINSPYVAYKDPTSLVCRVPTQIPVGDYRLRVGLSAADSELSATAAVFISHHPPVALSVFPAGGPSVGGSTITLSGSGFRAGPLSCRFGDRFGPAQFVNTSTVLCVLPPAPPGTVDISLSLNSQDWDGIPLVRSFVVYDLPTVSRVVPSAGPDQSRTSVTLFGQDFVAVDKPACRIRDIAVPATVVNSTVILCVLPRISTPTIHAAALSASLVPSEIVDSSTKGVYQSADLTAPSAYSVLLSLDGQIFSFSGPSFTFYPSPRITRLEPTSMPVAAGRLVVVRGERFRQDFGGFLCRIDNEVTETQFVSSMLASCISPVRSRGVSSLIEISMNGGVTFESHIGPPFVLLARAPVMQSAILDQTGQFFTVTFHLPTNGAGHLGGQLFSCDQVLSYNASVLSNMLPSHVITQLGPLPTVKEVHTLLFGPGHSCAWLSDTNLKVSLTHDAMIPLGMALPVLPNVLFRNGQPSYPASSAAILTPPVDSIRPVPVLSAPSSVELCRTITISASQSSGSALRPMHYKWSLTPADGSEAPQSVLKYAQEVSGVAFALSGEGCRHRHCALNNTCSDFSKPCTATSYSGCRCDELLLPAGLLSAGNWMVSLNLSNWLGRSADAPERVPSSSVFIQVTSLPSPSVTLIPAAFSTYTNRIVSLHASSSLPACANTTSRLSLEFSWSVFEVPDATFASTQHLVDHSSWTAVSLPSSIFTTAPSLLLPPSTLLPNKNYRAVVNVSISGAGHAAVKPSQAAGTITTMIQPVRLIVNRGTNSTASAFRDLLIDACASEDPEGEITGSNMVFSWSCSLPARGGVDCSAANSLFSLVGANTCKPRARTIGLALPLPRGERIEFKAIYGRPGEVPPLQQTALFSVFVTDGVSPIVAIQSPVPPVASGSILEFTASANLAPSDELSASGQNPYNVPGLSYSWLWSLPSVSGRQVDPFSENGALSVQGVPKLVLKPSFLPPGATFTVRATATPLIDGSLQKALAAELVSAAAEVEVQVNHAPSTGSFHVFPSNGTAIQTQFSVSASGFEDIDVPLTFIFEASFNISSQDWQQVARGSNQAKLFLQQGLASLNHRVWLRVRVVDAVGSETIQPFCVSGNPSNVAAECVLEVFPDPNANDADATVLSVSSFVNSAISLLDEGNPVQAVLSLSQSAQQMPASTFDPTDGCSGGCHNGTCRDGVCACPADAFGPSCAFNSAQWSARTSVRRNMLSVLQTSITMSSSSDSSMNEAVGSAFESLVSSPEELANDTLANAQQLLSSLLSDALSGSRQLTPVAVGSLLRVSSHLSTASSHFHKVASFGTSQNSIVLGTNSSTGNATSNNRRLLQLTPAQSSAAASAQSAVISTLLGGILSVQGSSVVQSPTLTATLNFVLGAARVEIAEPSSGGLWLLASSDVITVRGAIFRPNVFQLPASSGTNWTSATGEFIGGANASQALVDQPGSLSSHAVLSVAAFGPSYNPLSFDSGASASLVSDIFGVWFTPYAGSILPVLYPDTRGLRRLEGWKQAPSPNLFTTRIPLKRRISTTIDSQGRRFAPTCVVWEKTGADNQSHIVAAPTGGEGRWNEGSCNVTAYYTTNLAQTDWFVECTCSAGGLVAVRETNAGCDGVPNSPLVFDVCNVCNGPGTTCLGCDGVAFSNKVIDSCGVCGGDDTSCNNCRTPCGGVNSGQFLDACGVCGGDNSTCTGCDGVMIPPQVTSNTGRQKAAVDACGVCGGDGSTCAGCDGVPNSGKEFDRCGVCDPPLAQRDQCNLPTCPNGQVLDACAICRPFSEAGGQSCRGCDGVPRLYGRKQLDACGVCGGSNSTCNDCRGVPNGAANRDKCGVCEGSNACADCCGTPFGSAVFDVCNICDGPNSTAVCTGCDNILMPLPGRPAIFDSLFQCCPFAEIGCNGVCRASVGCDGICKPNAAQVDICGVCGGTNASNTGTCDCASVPFGNAIVGCDGICQFPPVLNDTCGVCGGTGLPLTGTCDCLGVANGNNEYDDELGCCSADQMGCDMVCHSGRILDACGVCAGDHTSCNMPAAASFKRASSTIFVALLLLFMAAARQLLQY